METYNKIIDDIVDNISNISVYFGHIKEYMKSNDPNGYKRFKDLDEFSTKYIKKLEKSTKTIDVIFHNASIINSLIDVINEMYKIASIDIHIGDNISKTESSNLVLLFDKISVSYKKFMQTLYVQREEILMEFYNISLSKNPTPKEISNMFRQYPNSIELYIKCMNHFLDEGYSKKETLPEIYDIIDSDKAHVLEEKKWNSPFLSFNLKPFKNFDTKDDLLKFLNEFKSTKTITIKRHQGLNSIIELPVQNDSTKGICSVMKLMSIFVFAKTDWSLGTIPSNDSTDIIIIEDMGAKFRILSPNWKPEIPSTKLRNLVDGKNDRPDKYNKLVELKILNKFNKHLREFMLSDFPEKQISHSIATCHHDIMKFIKTQSTSIKEMILHPNVLHIFKEFVMKELESELTDVRIYICLWLSNHFMNECRSVGSAEPTGEKMTKEQTLNVIDVQMKKILELTLIRNAKVFSIIPQKEYILNSIRKDIL